MYVYASRYSSDGEVDLREGTSAYVGTTLGYDMCAYTTVEHFIRNQANAIARYNTQIESGLHSLSWKLML